MAVPSSIFSSEKTMPRKGFPWSIVIALGLVLTLEVFLHSLPSSELLKYGTGLAAYYEVLHTIESQGSAEIAVLGSSRGRESLVMPKMKSMVSEDLNREVSVANYSCPDGKADELLLVSRMLLESNNKPHLILYFLSPRVLQGDELNIMRREVLGVFPNQYGKQNKHLLASFSEKPIWDFRNKLASNYFTFRHRYRIRNFFVSTIRSRKATSPIQGELTSWQIYTPDRSLVNRPVSSKHIKSFVDRMLNNKSSSSLNAVRIQALHDNIVECQKEGVEIILVAAPLSDLLLKEFPPDYYSNFMKVIVELHEETGVPWVDSNQLGISLGLEDFREQSHLNLSGATKMTAALCQQMIIPRMSN